MADSRINLLSSASSSASDDFFVVDGTTNGTRKLNAFSPTFGGNPTVTGTLTVNGTSTFNNTVTISTNVGFIGKSGSGTGGNWRYISDDGTSRWLSGILGSPSETAFDIYDIVNGRSLLTLTAAGVVKVPQTTASTTTSTGALVVGNGTSGGLGVGGSIVLGANLVSTASDGKIQVNGTGNTTGNKELTFQRSDAADSFAVGLTGSAYAGGLTGLGNNEAYLYNSSASAFRVFLGTAATNRFDFTSTQFKINATTASTTTSSGALVVSGGVGVAGAMYIGGLIECSSASGIRIRTASGTAASFAVIQTGNATWEFKSPASDSSLVLRANDTTNALQLTNVGNGIFAGSVSTAAPSGGTSAAWKLGTVATVSPTSPNRTIEVDIGGTIYYLAAKTTNN